MIDEVLGGPDWRTDLFDTDAYLAAIGVEPDAPTHDLLERLHRGHVRTFPFANIDVLLRSHPGVAPDRVRVQMLDRRRGGYCFEHAQILAAALEALGFRVRRVLGRVHSQHANRSHMSVLVDVDETRWLCDPGFGFSIEGPIELADGAIRTDGDRTHEIARVFDQDHPQWRLSRDGEVQHFIDETPVHPPEIRAAHFVTSQFEHSGFLRRLIVARHLPDAHVTLTETHRTIRATGRETIRGALTVDEVIAEIGRLGVELTEAERRELGLLIRRLR